MPVERFFADTLFSLQEECVLEDLEFHHLVNVIRCKPGDLVELVNGRNQLAEARIQKIEKKRVFLSIDSFISKEPSKPLTLAQGIPRFNRLEFILEKGTELGATAFWLFPGEWSEKGEFSENQIKRMQLILISAMKQCGRLDLPEILFKPPLANWDTPGIFLYGDTREDAPTITPPYPPSPILIVGPERGLSPHELGHLSKLGAHGVRLNPHILRTDTAAIAFLSILASHP